MNRNDLWCIKHMLDSADAILSFTSGRQRRDLDHDRMLTGALIKEFLVIGEAASKVSKETRDLLPKIEWVKIIGMRNWLVHAYFQIDLDTVWDTVKKDIPELIKELEKISDIR